ncbi:MAG: hypothetical protein HQK89_06720 [Nitrospirae bacterium]|nr:hypothetical protein [Nitrospirota bacterium]
MNEIEMPSIVGRHSGTVIVAGGGKFTARFGNPKDAEDARKEIIKLIPTTLPMLEFQVSKVIVAANIKKIAKKDGVFESLNKQKRYFRGYGVSYNPHLRICPECGEYPSIDWPDLRNPEDPRKNFCSVCFDSYRKARIDENLLNPGMSGNGHTTLERIYQYYTSSLFKDDKDIVARLKIPLDFEDLFPKDKQRERVRMAVWFSDLNNMGPKVRIWQSQPDDNDIRDIFSMVTKVNVEIVSKALINTFDKSSLTLNKTDNEYLLPFRLIVAGGDDLRIVMAEEYIFDFILNLSSAVHEKVRKIEGDQSNPLSVTWLQKAAKKKAEEERAEGDNDVNEQEIKESDIKPYSFGGSFVVTSIHTPFKKIHEACEDMMGKAKEGTERKDNSVYWTVLSVEDAPNVKDIMKFEKPLLIEEENKDNNGDHMLSFRKYTSIRDFYSGILSGSHIQQIALKMIKFENDSTKVEEWMKKMASTELEKSFAYVLVDKNFRKKDGKFMCERLATLFELLSISRKGDAI